jgi:hypothetical protein
LSSRGSTPQPLLSVTNCVALYTANMLARAGIVN